MSRYSELLHQVVVALGSAGEKRDLYTANHQARATTFATAICRKLGFSPDRTKAVRMATQLHDIGKIGVPMDILAKPGRLSEGEYAIVKAHSQIGHDIIKDIGFPWPVAEFVLDHHETLDGSGYPNGKKGKHISTEARVVSVADMVDAMLSHRPYQAAKDRKDVIRILRKERKSRLDPDVVDAGIELLESGFELA